MIAGFKAYCDKCNKLIEAYFPEPVFAIKSEDRRCTNSNCQKFINSVNYDYCNAVIVELQDLEQFNDLERLSVYLFDKNTENIRVGENVIVNGQIQINELNGKKKLFPYLYVESIEYDKNDKITLTELDIDAINRFTNKHDSIIDELVSMFDNSIIGHEYVKRGLLLSAVNSNGDTDNHNERRERIHSLLIGVTGLAKSKLLRSITRLIPNSRYESGGRNSSGKSLTAIVAKEDENYVLRLGAIPLAKSAICAINEFGRTDYEDQAHFLDIMEEGDFTINKYGIHASIKSPTTIIGSANPINNSTWMDDDKIDLNEIPALKPINDRFDLIFVFRPKKNEDEIRDYAYKKSGFESNKIPDFSNYVVKHLEYAKRFNPVISDEAQQMLNEYFIEIMLQDNFNFGSNRLLDTLFRLSKAFARLKLKAIVDGDDARDTIQFYNVVLQQYQQAVSVPTNPRDVTYKECLNILRETQAPITLEELLKQACHNNTYIERYLCFGNKPLRLRDNIKLRSVYDMLLNHTNVRRIQEKPVVLQWLCDPCDPCDPQKQKGKPENNPITSDISDISKLANEKTGSHTSHTSHRDKKNQCYYCPEGFDFESDYKKHVINKHPKKLCYPDKAYIEKHGLTPQGKKWEI
jgi:replicative DNA helicase Mcm